MLAPKKRPAKSVRNPDRTRERILTAALREFADCGFAGARVDAIARRSGCNKRMLYHYFGDKEEMFRAVLRHKISQRIAIVEAQSPGKDIVSAMPQWFIQNCQDADWVRLLAWESLQTLKDSVIDESERFRRSRWAAQAIKKKQMAKILRADVPPAFLLLAKVSLAMFPMAMPQVTRLLTGKSPRNAKFQKDYAKFLETISAAFRP
jgi:TetR/AcrR family transcriptional regulator